jgi:hypothetical protein
LTERRGILDVSENVWSSKVKIKIKKPPLRDNGSIIYNKGKVTHAITIPNSFMQRHKKALDLRPYILAYLALLFQGKLALSSIYISTTQAVAGRQFSTLENKLGLDVVYVSGSKLVLNNYHILEYDKDIYKNLDYISKLALSSIYISTTQAVAGRQFSTLEK